MKGCMFCDQESNKNAPENVVAQNEYATAVLAGFLREGHCVVNLKRHIESISELTPKEYNGLFEIIVKVSKAIEKRYNIQKVYLYTISDGVTHLHFHMLPKHPNLPSMMVYMNKLKETENPKPPTPAEQNATAKEIRELINNL
jgi:diadenosine tetraphosphate (Ap4A) HIT family hydrolase